MSYINELEDWLRGHLGRAVYRVERKDTDSMAIRFEDPYLTNELYEGGMYITKQFKQAIEKLCTDFYFYHSAKVEINHTDKDWFSFKVTPVTSSKKEDCVICRRLKLLPARQICKINGTVFSDIPQDIEVKYCPACGNKLAE